MAIKWSPSSTVWYSSLTSTDRPWTHTSWLLSHPLSSISPVLTSPTQLLLWIPVSGIMGILFPSLKMALQCSSFSCPNPMCSLMLRSRLPYFKEICLKKPLRSRSWHCPSSYLYNLYLCVFLQHHFVVRNERFPIYPSRLWTPWWQGACR